MERAGGGEEEDNINNKTIYETDDDDDNDDVKVMQPPAPKRAAVASSSTDGMVTRGKYAAAAAVVRVTVVDDDDNDADTDKPRKRGRPRKRKIREEDDGRNGTRIRSDPAPQTTGAAAAVGPDYFDAILQPLPAVIAQNRDSLRKELKAWQYSLTVKLELPAILFPRSINWIYDTIGQTGKTWMQNWLERNLNALFLGTADSEIRDNLLRRLCDRSYVKRVIRPAHTPGTVKPSPIYIVELPRGWDSSRPVHRDIYRVLEEIKDGCVRVTVNGQSVMIGLQPSHVIVFAHAPPKDGCIAEDRLEKSVICLDP